MSEIDPKKIEVDKQYQYEAKYHFACIVTVLANESGEDKEKRHSKDWIGYKLRVDAVIFGDKEVGEEFSCGYDEKYGQAYREWKFKSIGSQTDYMGLR